MNARRTGLTPGCFWGPLCIVFLGYIASASLCAGSDAEREAETAAVGSSVSYGGEVAFNSRYLWRGIACSEGLVVQPSIWVSVLDLTSTIWGNVDTKVPASAGDLNEFDVTLAHSRQIGVAAVEPSFTLFVYPNQENAPSTGELSCRLSCPLGPISIATTQAFDAVRYVGSYFGDLSLSVSVNIGSQLSVESSVGMGWGSAKFNEAYVGCHHSALDALNGAVVISYSPMEAAFVSLRGDLSSTLDGDIRSHVEDTTLASIGMGITWEL